MSRDYYDKFFPRLKRLVDKVGLLKVLKRLFPLVLLALALSCASTVTPKIVTHSEASWDQNQHNSGFLGFDAAGNGMLTPHARDRYNELVGLYGARFLPPLKFNEGVQSTTTNVFIMDAQHLTYFARMNRWKLNSPPK